MHLFHGRSDYILGRRREYSPSCCIISYCLPRTYRLFASMFSLSPDLSHHTLRSTSTHVLSESTIAPHNIPARLPPHSAAHVSVPCRFFVVVSWQYTNPHPEICHCEHAFPAGHCMVTTVIQ
ncbi:hypothetical protein BD311DRAFT_323639 [Dichomitus squalens]|uniref:Uncharacterized protein n=1 Tax=Dichomitus squalens TaxID=114155 RepID=A0A4V2K0D5_9APHY|nr:hypothetical protein BD311DRAFT_323639 [Dichomitus squalens]